MLCDQNWAVLIWRTGVMDWEEPQKQPKTAMELGCDLDTISIEELEDRIVALKQEISRCEAAIQSKQVQRSAADSIFKS